MSLERIVTALVNLGLSNTDARVYIHLAIRGPSLTRNLGKSLKMNCVEILKSLKKLQNIGIVTDCKDNLGKSLALPFGQALEMLIEVKEKQAKEVKKRRKELLANWKVNGK
jgi:predicted transcriptional regulator